MPNAWNAFVLLAFGFGYNGEHPRPLGAAIETYRRERVGHRPARLLTYLPQTATTPTALWSRWCTPNSMRHRAPG